MGQRIVSWPARCLAFLVTPFLVLGVMAATTPASAAAGYSQQAELTAGRGEAFGNSVALSASGSTALVGAPDADMGGAAYVFTLRHGTWSQTAELTAPDGARGDLFGSSVALSALGSTALVGEPFGHSDAGAAYVFTLRNGTWSRTAELTASDAAPGDGFGNSVGLSASGSTALAGAPFRHSSAGAAYVFTLRNGTWSQTAELTASDAAPLDWFGLSVALSASGGTALAGAPRHHPSAGAAYVFTLRHGTWSQTAELTAPDAAPLDWFGGSVALSASGGTALAGAQSHNAEAGAAYVFTLRAGTWSEIAELTAPFSASGGGLGLAVTLSGLGSTALAGAFGRYPVTGAAYVFTLRHGTWSRTVELTASDAAPGDGFGNSVALSASGSTALAGAPSRNANTGAVYVFTEAGSRY
jgi:hypothetical protein